MTIERDKCLYFKRGYKYQTSRDYHIKVSIWGQEIDTSYVSLDKKGNLLIRKGYAWDGASGPTWDTLNSMAGSLVHDVLYQMIRQGLLHPYYKQYADELLHDVCTEDGMFAWRADYWRWAVLKFGAGSCRPSAEPVEEVAP